MPKTNETPLFERLVGRCTELRPTAENWALRLERAGFPARDFSFPAGEPPCAVGDIVGVRPGVGAHFAQLTVLTRTERPGALHWHRRIQDPRRIHALRIRREVESGIRAFFTERDFIETTTPTLVPCPGMEIHVPTFRTTAGAFLPTSPEFAMKRLLVGGLERIFQLARSYRAEPASSTHSPEFTMLEWYRAYAGLREIMVDAENLVEALALRIHGKPEISFGGHTISVAAPWPRFTIAELFREHVGIELTEKTPAAELARVSRERGHGVPDGATWDDLFFLLFLNEIEPRLPSDRAVIVSHYPPSQAALAVIETNERGERWARRFEFYVAGLELGNAFEELTNAAEQRARFVADMNERERIYGKRADEFGRSPLDEDFLAALSEGMPPSGGIAVGVDRLVMLLADESDIERTVWLPSGDRAEP